MRIALGLLLSLLICVTACSRAPSHGDSQTSENPAEQIYTCSMHPQVRHKGPGQCPICGMNLIPLQQQQSEPSTSDASQPAAVHLTNAQDSIASIRTEPATLRALSQTLQLFGEITPVQGQTVNYTWYYAGRVQKLLVNPNTTRVEKDQPLIEVYSEEALADQQAYLEALRERWLSTFYERDLLTARMEAVKTRLAQVGLTDADLENLVENHAVQKTFTIRAPMDGTLTTPLPAVGMRFEIKDTLFTVAPLDPIWLVADAYEKDLSLLKLGDTAEISTSANLQQTFTGKLVYIERALDPAKRSAKVRFQIANPQRNLMPMLSAVAILKTQSQKMLTIPTSAIIDTGTRKIVYIQTAPAAYQPRQIQTAFEGTSPDSPQPLTAIASGLTEGDAVVTAGAFLLDAEAQLKTTAPDSAATPPPPH